MLIAGATTNPDEELVAWEVAIPTADMVELWLAKQELLQQRLWQVRGFLAAAGLAAVAC